MKLAVVEKTDQYLQVRRLNTSYIADLKGGLIFWISSLIFFGSFHFLMVFLNKTWPGTGRTPSSVFPVFPTAQDFLLLIPLTAFVVGANLLPDSGLLASQVFSFDQDKNAFSVDGRYAAHLDKISIRLQWGFTSHRKAFRLVVTAWDRDYIIAQTQRFIVGKRYDAEYSSFLRSEGMQKHWPRRWADYTGGKTGFPSKWPEYQEIFALHDELTKFIEASKGELQTERR